MSSSETESEPELPADSFSTPAAFAQLSAARHASGSPEAKSVQWALDTLAMLDFRAIREDISLHHIIQDCASILLNFIHGILDQSNSFVEDIESIMVNVTSLFNPSFMQLLFQYRRIFHFIAMNSVDPGYAVPTVVCWVDVVLAKLGDLSALLAAGFHSYHPDRTLPDALKARRQEDSIRAAIQLPGTWDMVPSLLPSERASPAAKRLTIRLLFGQHVLHSRPNSRCKIGDAPTRELLLTFSEHVQQSAVQLPEAGPAIEFGSQQLIQQDHLTNAMMISLFAVCRYSLTFWRCFGPSLLGC
ncbi:hypothetical protein F5I97DRAFT_1580022 [Phlebopus sp. FC_14]|nr:hypothetical protein F5I97DRAFT_1580022 [Phlebopus sp. FC_14]